MTLGAFKRLPGLEITDPREFQAVPGKEVKAVLDDRCILIGSRRYLQEQGVEVEPLLPALILLFSNWLNYYVYQETPYELNEIG